MSERKISKFEVSPVPIRSLSETHSDNGSTFASPNVNGNCAHSDHTDSNGVNVTISINGSGNSATQETQFSSPKDAMLENGTKLAENDVDQEDNLKLYAEDMKNMPRVATFLKNFMVPPATHPNQKEVEITKRKPKAAKLGTVLGVYLPTVQHIVGLLMFMRHAWIVGCAGLIQSTIIVFMCCLTTFLTSISVSAIATNGIVPAGGAYVMLSRNLGAKWGGAIGICFYLANTYGTVLYLLGGIEILLHYMAPGIAIFGSHGNPWNNYRLYGTIALLFITLIVAVGVRFVQMFAPISLVCVIVSYFAVVIGAFQANEHTRDVWICLLGDRLMVSPENMTAYNDTMSWCTKNVTGDIWHRYCGNGSYIGDCDPYFQTRDIVYKPGIPGMFSDVASRNAFSFYMGDNEVEPGVEGSHERGEVVTDIATSFVILCGIFFPSVTGILTGANMSGDLKDPQKSIPIGTILAQLTASFAFMSFVFMYGLTTEGFLLRDKFGASQGGELLSAQLCWPNKWVVLVGAFCSAVGAALQCITSAPRLLQAIARDGIIPFLDVFKVVGRNGEPLRALLLTALIAETGVLIANIDLVAPIIDVFFVMCYGFVNVVCVMQTLLKSPHWRPRFKYYHWSLSLVGVLLNFALAFMAGWYFALAALAMLAFIYKYIEYKGGEQEWGDGVKGLTMSAAQQALLQLDEGDPHTKNWRPQLLVLCELDSELQLEYSQIGCLASQLKAGKGLTIMAAVLKGEYLDKFHQADLADENLKATMEEHKIKGFSKVVVSNEVSDGINHLIQTVGLGGLRHNAVIVGWPHALPGKESKETWKLFLETVRVVRAKGLALLVPRNIEKFPHNKDRLVGTIDIWWIIHDGGMLLLLAFLLRQHKVWRQCKLRLFTVAQLRDNSIQMKKDLEHYLYQIRIDAEVHVEEMHESDVSAFTVELTLDMERRSRLLKELKIARGNTVDDFMLTSHTSHSSLQPAHASAPEIIVTSPTMEVFEEDEGADARGDGVRKGKVTFQIQDFPDSPDGKDEEGGGDDYKPYFTFTPLQAKQLLESTQRQDSTQSPSVPTSQKTRRGSAKGRLMRMHTAVRLNEVIRAHSNDASLVIINFPAPPMHLSASENYMEYLEVMTNGIERVLMVRGSGREVITMFS